MSLDCSTLLVVFLVSKVQAPRLCINRTYIVHGHPPDMNTQRCLKSGANVDEVTNKAYNLLTNVRNQLETIGKILIVDFSDGAYLLRGVHVKRHEISCHREISSTLKTDRNQKDSCQAHSSNPCLINGDNILKKCFSFIAVSFQVDASQCIPVPFLYLDSLMRNLVDNNFPQIETFLHYGPYPLMTETNLER
ncbi:hypothetical protein TNCV_2785031 [Trichonephila clavipes]|nr:hypothetical protein TNCV_2785031 [Trichonephila clavipes]